MGENIVRECHTDAKAQDYAQWQVVAFILPLTQQEASGWWDAPPWPTGLCPQDFILITNASGTKDFQTLRQEKTLALAWALQACAERWGAPTATQHENSKNALPP